MLQLIALFSLAHSFGIVATARYIKTGGTYASVFQPLYAAYLVSHISLVVDNLCVANVAVFGCWLGFQLFRVVEEEQPLMQDPAHRDHAARVRWRVLPYLC